uniref:Protein kinase domain-containing protein n=1 Tax=viral metagenome TaxID=1070528 RepID=A0A6C0IW50_9ZZZZ
MYMINLTENQEFILIKDFEKIPRKESKNDRAVYINKNEGICLKIPKNNKKSILGAKSELTFYNSLSESLKKIFSKPLGILDTNLGNAYVFELIKNENDISMTLDSYINKYGKNNNIYNKYLNLVNLIIKNNIKIHKFHLKNAVVKLKNKKITDIIIVDYEFSKTKFFFLPRVYYKLTKRMLYKKYINLYIENV